MRFENEYRMMEEKVSGTAHLFTLVHSQVYYSVEIFNNILNTCF